MSPSKKGQKTLDSPLGPGCPEPIEFHGFSMGCHGIPRVLHPFGKTRCFSKTCSFVFNLRVSKAFLRVLYRLHIKNCKKNTGSPKFFLKPCQDLSNKTLKTQFLVLTVKSKEKQCACMEESNIAAVGFRWAIGPGMIEVHGMWCFYLLPSPHAASRFYHFWSARTCIYYSIMSRSYTHEELKIFDGQMDWHILPLSCFRVDV